MDTLIDPAKLVVEAVDKGDWKLAAAAALVVVVWVLRAHLIGRISATRLIQLGVVGDVLAWLGRTYAGGVFCSLVIGTGGAVSTALIAHQPMTRHLLLSAITTSAIASGLFTWIRALPPTPVPGELPAPTPPPPPPEGGAS